MLTVNCQSGSKCTVQVTMCQLTNAAASKDQEKPRLLFPNCWKSEEGQPQVRCAGKANNSSGGNFEIQP